MLVKYVKNIGLYYGLRKNEQETTKETANGQEKGLRRRPTKIRIKNEIKCKNEKKNVTEE
jgi:hypothetical protein